MYLEKPTIHYNGKGPEHFNYIFLQMLSDTKASLLMIDLIHNLTSISQFKLFFPARGREKQTIQVTIMPDS